MQGTNLALLLSGETEIVQDAVRVESHPSQPTLYPQRLITADHKRIVYR